MCVSQEFLDEQPLGSRSVEHRLERVETMIEHLTRAAAPREVRNELSPSVIDDSRSWRDEVQPVVGHGPSVGIATPAPSDVGISASLASLVRESVHDPEPETAADRNTLLNPPLSADVVTPGQVAQGADRHDELCRALLAAWPRQRDLEVILSLPIGISGLSHGAICMPYSAFSGQDVPSLQDILQPPPPRSHPVLIARTLLVLGTLLQGVPPCSSHTVGSLSTSYLDIMSRVVEAAYSLVICNDELVNSIEGIECIAMWSMYQNNAGNLRRAWMAMRRAMLIAQMMGLHRDTNSSSLTILESRNRTRPDKEHIWFRLLRSDRYLSMMLGLPQCSPQDSLTTSKAFERCTLMERMQRIHCAAGGRILQRNQAEVHDLTETQEIDLMMQRASAFMPPQWWLIPNLAFSQDSKGEKLTLHETIRLMDQFTHYHLLVQLHLPYLLRFSADHNYDYHKIMAINASRELLARYVSFRSSSPSKSYCRGVDFLAFIASTALCLAYIDAYHQYHMRAANRYSSGNTIFNVLAHQRLSDRGMMERTLECMENMAHTGPDVIATKVASILRHLLVIEADAVTGASYTTDSSTEGGEGELGCSGKLSDGGNVLCIHIPYFGTIKVERSGVSKSVSMPSVLSAEEFQDTPMPEISESNPVVSFGPSVLFRQQVECEPQSLPTADYPATYKIGDLLVNPDWQDAPSQFHSPDDNDIHNTQLLVSGFAADANDWALQGVEMAFFDSLMRRSRTPNVGGGPFQDVDVE